MFTISKVINFSEISSMFLIFFILKCLLSLYFVDVYCNYHITQSHRMSEVLKIPIASNSDTCVVEIVHSMLEVEEGV